MKKEHDMHKKIGAVLSVPLLASIALVGTSGSASAADAANCTTTSSVRTVVVTPANTKTVHHDEMTKTVHHDAEYNVVFHEAVVHDEARWTKTYPAVEESSHTEYKYERTVVDYKTQYHFRKYTQTKTRTAATPDLWWNWSPNNSQGPQDYTPEFPTDARGTWQGPHENGGPSQSTYGTFDTGADGRSNWFHRDHGTPQGEWSEYGPWTPWTPETHTSWQDSTDSLGSPEFHGSGTYEDGTEWYRVWQARYDGQTRQVENGSHKETTEWVTVKPEGDGWVQVDSRKVVDSDATPAKTVYYLNGGGESTDLTDANWTTDFASEEDANEAGWNFVDDREVTDEEAYFEQVLVKEPYDETVVVTAARDEKIVIPAVTKKVTDKDTKCVTPPVASPPPAASLAFTGSDTKDAALLGAFLLALGIAGSTVAQRKRG